MFLASLVALLPAIALCTSVEHLHGTSTPLLVWSNSGIVGQGQGSQVMYEVLENVEQVVGSMVLGASGKADAHSVEKLLKLDQLSNEKQNAIIIFAGSQIDAASLRKSGPSSKLDNAIGSAASSLVVPHATFTGDSLQKSLMSVLQAASVDFQAVGCGSEASEDFGADVAKALADTGKLQVVLVCSRVSSVLDHSPAGLDAELEQLAAVQEAVEASGFSHVFVYASQPCTDSHKRSLLQVRAPNPRRQFPPPPPTKAPGYYGFGPYTACGPLCQTQVRWMEGILALIFLALASCSGLTCLLVLNTPTRFEVPKEGVAM